MLKKVAWGEFHWCQSLFLKPHLSGFACSLPGKCQGAVGSTHCHVLPLAASVADFSISGGFRQ